MAQTVKHLSTTQETWVWSLGWKDPLEKEMAIHSSTIAWKIPWTEEPGRLQSMGSQRVGHDWATSLSFHFQCHLVSLLLSASLMGHLWEYNCHRLFQKCLWAFTIFLTNHSFTMFFPRKTSTEALTRSLSLHTLRRWLILKQGTAEPAFPNESCISQCAWEIKILVPLISLYSENLPHNLLRIPLSQQKQNRKRIFEWIKK